MYDKSVAKVNVIFNGRYVLKTLYSSDELAIKENDDADKKIPYTS